MGKIKEWILNRGFIFEALDEAFKRGVENERTENLGLIKRYEQARIKTIDDEVNERINQLLSIVDTKMIVSMEKTPNGQTAIVYIGGKRIDEGQLYSLKAEAEYISASYLWKILYETPKELAQRQMFVSSESLDDMKKGKTILYTLSTQKNIIDTFKNVVARKS